MSLDVDKMLINPDYIKNHIEQIKQTQAEVTNTVNSNPKTASLPDDTKKLLVQDIISKFE
ncbi:MAG: hypothetical protein LBQ24_06155 [Candidatus Peribacteria bacterium]|jgi:hypothetical protein|nr:hypothetical protein [Candidatus Peribacteria bacterium]